MADKDTIKQVIEVVTKGEDKLDGIIEKNKEYKKTAKDSEESNKKLGVSYKALAAGAAGFAVALAGAVKVAHDMVEAADRVGKASQRMGVSVQFYQKIESAAKHAGTSVGAFESANRKMLMNLQALQEGSKKTTRVFNELGVSVKNNDGTFRNQEELLTDSLMALADMEDVTKRNSLAMEVLGRNAADLNPLLNEGSEAIAKYVKGNESAVMVSDNLAKDSARVNDAIQTLGESITKATNSGLEPFISSLANMAERLNDSALFKTFTDGITGVLRLASDAALALDWMAGGQKEFEIMVKAMDTRLFEESISELEKQQDRLKGVVNQYTEMSKKAGPGAVGLSGVLGVSSKELEDVEREIELLNKAREEYLHQQELLQKTIEEKKKNAGGKGGGGTSSATGESGERGVSPEIALMAVQMKAYDEAKEHYLRGIEEKKEREEYFSDFMKKQGEKRLQETLQSIEITRKSEEKAAGYKKSIAYDVANMSAVLLKDNAKLAWGISSSLATADAIGAIISTIRDVKGGVTSKLSGAAAITGVTTGLISQLASTKPKFYNGGEVPSNGRSGDSQLALVRSGERVLTPSENRAYKVAQNKVTNNNTRNSNVTINATFNGGNMQDIESRLPALVARGLEQADRENIIDYQRLSNLHKAVR